MPEICCPFCNQKADSEYLILYHLELVHPGGDRSLFNEADLPLPAQQGSNELDVMEDQYIQMGYASCPVDGCDEAILLQEYETHLDMHAIEYGDCQGNEALSEDMPAKRVRMEDHSSGPPTFSKQPQKDNPSTESSETRQEIAKACWRSLLRMPNSMKMKSSPKSSQGASRGPKRLGKAELGPYANEAQMPSWLYKLLSENDGGTKSVMRPDKNGKMRKVEFSPNQTEGIVPVIAQLLEQDMIVSYAYVCHPGVVHVSRLFREGGFCGYRNIQSLISYINATSSQGYPYFDRRIPSIFEVQDYIENAWDRGINRQGRVETGGVRGTRKYIGTSEAQALFLSLEIPCEAQAMKPNNGKRADELLRETVEQYFEAGRKDHAHKVRRTMLPPLYLQHAGHSLTIIGCERLKDGTKNLLCFDPMFSDASAVRKYIGQTFREPDPTDRLRAYRRGNRYLGKYKEFEILRLMPNQNT